MLANAARTASALVRWVFRGAGVFAAACVPGIIGSICVGAVGRSTGCIPIGPVLSEGGCRLVMIVSVQPLFSFEGPGLRPVTTGLDASGKSPATVQHRKNYRARAGNPAAGFLNRACDEAFKLLLYRAAFKTLSLREKKLLCRRANHLHLFTIARIAKPAPGDRPRAF